MDRARHGSVVPPSNPLLVLSACYGPDHTLTLSWDWLYDVNGTRLRSPLRPYGVVQGEREVLDSLHVPIDRYVPQAALRGMDTMRFTTEVLPLLRGHPSVVLDVDGEPPPGKEIVLSVHPYNGKA